MKKAVFFDRDGTVNVDKNYLYKVEEFEFRDGILELLEKYRKLGYLLILITNQSGVARGYYTENDIKILHDFMQQELKKQNLQFDAIYYCPHHPEGIVKKYACNCNCRKPKKGLFKRAIEEWGIEAKQSIAIGDKERDILPAKELGMCVYLVNEHGKIEIGKEQEL